MSCHVIGIHLNGSSSILIAISQYAQLLGGGREPGAAKTLSRSNAVVINDRHCILTADWSQEPGARAARKYLSVYKNAAINSMSC